MSDRDFQPSAFSTKSEDPLCNSDHYTPSSDTLLKYEDLAPLADLNDPPLDLGEPAFMDLFTESEPSQERENVVCDCLLPAAHLTSSLGYTYCNFHVYDQAAIAEILTPWMLQFETSGSEEITDPGHLFSTDNDTFTLAGLDDDWETIGLQLSPTQRRSYPPLDDDDLGYMALDRDASLTIFPWHTSICSDFSCFCDLGSTTLNQRALDLDSEDEDIAEEEAVLDF